MDFSLAFLFTAPVSQPIVATKIVSVKLTENLLEALIPLFRAS